MKRRILSGRAVPQNSVVPEFPATEPVAEKPLKPPNDPSCPESCPRKLQGIPGKSVVKVEPICVIWIRTLTIAGPQSALSLVAKVPVQVPEMSTGDATGVGVGAGVLVRVAAGAGLGLGAAVDASVGVADGRAVGVGCGGPVMVSEFLQEIEAAPIQTTRSGTPRKRTFVMTTSCQLGDEPLCGRCV